MKLLFKKDELLNSINIVSKAVPARTTNPVLECILFDATGKDIKLIGNDIELGIETIVEGTIYEKGKIALDAKLINEIIRKAENSDSEILIESDKEFNTEIKLDNSVFNITGRDGEEFPYLAFVEKSRFINISEYSLKEVIRQTVFSASVNDNNKMMGGEFIEVNNNKIRFTTLDGHRISIRNLESKENFGKFNSIVPVRSLNEISKIIEDDNDKNIIVYFSDNYVLFEIGKTNVLSRVINGEYFRISHMLSSDYDTKVIVNKNKLVNYIDRANIFVKENDHRPILLKITESSINVSIKSSYGAMDGNIDCIKEGEDLKIAFNPKFLIDALRSIDDENVSLYFTNAKAPCFIRDEEEKYIYLILPVNFIE